LATDGDNDFYGFICSISRLIMIDRLIVSIDPSDIARLKAQTRLISLQIPIRRTKVTK
jgi:hypothetical protein